MVCRCASGAGEDAGAENMQSERSLYFRNVIGMRSPRRCSGRCRKNLHLHETLPGAARTLYPESAAPVGHRVIVFERSAVEENEGIFVSIATSTRVRWRWRRRLRHLHQKQKRSKMQIPPSLQGCSRESGTWEIVSFSLYGCKVERFFGHRYDGKDDDDDELVSPNDVSELVDSCCHHCRRLSNGIEHQLGQSKK
ncbi:hypothetical protein ZHAS_00013188 [Anopheles sinensis]|uniref:Uncharacterized protein n=1 Tax=Anopheles sinensis TaxID=74873 RepID=A0A084W4W9_ANOSI|nr:hypothetical protein ZHAS_00013188 [Anopheles sinensis]